MKTMRKLQPGDKIEAQVSGFCGGPVCYEKVLLTWVSENGASWAGNSLAGDWVRRGSTGDCVLLEYAPE